MGMRELEGQGCLLCDEMGLGKSVQAIALLWTLMRVSLGGFVAGAAEAFIPQARIQFSVRGRLLRRP